MGESSASTRSASTGHSAPASPVDGIVADGNRQLTRRRAIGVLGGTAATAAAVVGGATVGRSAGRTSVPEPARRPTPFTDRRATYAVGTRIHYGTDVISTAGHDVKAFVQTAAGFVFLDDENAIYVADGTDVRRLAKSAWDLTAPGSGSMVGWVEGFNDHFESVVYDVAAGHELVRTKLGNKVPRNVSLAMSPRIVALDSDAAYLSTLDGLYRWELRSGSSTKVSTAAVGEVLAVSAGRFLYRNPRRPGFAEPGLIVGPEPGKPAGRSYPANQGYLSPEATYLLTGSTASPQLAPQATALDLYAVQSGTKLPLRHPGYIRLIFSQWLDDTTFTAVGVRAGKHPPVDLLTCSAATLNCKVSVAAFSTYTFDQAPPRETPFALPVGTRILEPN
jgi:hypothetical protein